MWTTIVALWAMVSPFPAVRDSSSSFSKLGTGLGLAVEGRRLATVDMYVGSSPLSLSPQPSSRDVTLA